MLNSDFLNEQARVLAERLKREAGKDVAERVRHGLSLALTRVISDAEVNRGVTLIKKLQAEDGVSADDALRIFCLMVLNLNEFFWTILKV